MKKKFLIVLFLSLVLSNFLLNEQISAQKPSAVIPYGTADIDGLVEETWNLSEEHAIDKPFMKSNPTVNAYWKAMYDKDNFYIVINVEDEGNHWPGWEAGGSSWEYDRPEIYWDWNTILTDKGGTCCKGSGHYEFCSGFLKDKYGIVITDKQVEPGYNYPGATYCYTLTGENYIYEIAVPFKNFYTWNMVQITKDIAVSRTAVGFDVTIVDQDEGITNMRQRAVWSSDQEESWASMDDAGTITFDNSPKDLYLSRLESKINCIEGSQSSVDVISSLVWKAESDQNWLQLNTSTGKGNGSVIFTATENRGTDRTAIVTFTADGASSKVVKVKQTGWEPVLSVSPQEIIAPCAGNSSYKISVSSNVPWNATSDQSWIKIDSVQSCTGNCILNITLEDNFSNIRRKGNVTITDDSGVSQKVEITQAVYEPVLSVNYSNISVNWVASSNLFTLTSNLSWNITCSEPWLTVDQTSGTGTKTINFKVEESLVPVRTAKITVTAKGYGSRTIEVQQGWFSTQEATIRSFEPVEIDGFMEKEWECADEYYIERTLYSIEYPTVFASWKAMCDYDNFYVFVTVTGDANYWPGWAAGGDKLNYDMPVIYWDWNEFVEDGLGPSTNFSGHYRFAAGFEADQYGFPQTEVPSSPGDYNPGGTYCYSFWDEGYTYEIGIPFSNFYDKEGKQMSRSLAFSRNPGFDVEIINRDQGDSIPQRMVWSSQIADCWNNMDNAGRINSWGWCDNIGPDLDAFEIYGNNIHLSAHEGSKDTIDVFCYGNWSSVSDQSWLSIANVSTTPWGSIILTAQANTTNAPRTAKVTITANRLGSQTITVTQDASTVSNTIFSGEIELYPNPATSDFQIHGLKGGATVSLIDQDGRVVLSKQIYNKGTIEVGSLPKGMYVVKVVTSSGIIKKKLVVGNRKS
jgi:hypothetical protein